jgi:hypothetical protein
MIKGKFGMLSPMWKIMLKGKQQLTTEKEGPGGSMS